MMTPEQLGKLERFLETGDDAGLSVFEPLVEGSLSHAEWCNDRPGIRVVTDPPGGDLGHAYPMLELRLRVREAHSYFGCGSSVKLVYHEMCCGLCGARKIRGGVVVRVPLGGGLTIEREYGHERECGKTERRTDV